MSEYDNTEQINQGLNAAKEAGQIGVDAGRTTVNAGRGAARLGRNAGKAARAGGEAASTANPVMLKIKLIILAAVILVIFTTVLTGSISSSLRRVFRTDPIHSSKKTIEAYAPENKTEKDEALYDKDIAREDTEKLVGILHQVKQEDFGKIQNTLSKRIAAEVGRQNKNGEGIDYDASAQNIKSELAVNSHYIYPGTGTLGNGSGSAIADITERVAWPDGTDSSRYRARAGGSPTEAYKELKNKWYPNRSMITFACCCHSANVVVCEATGKKIGNLLPNTNSSSDAYKQLQDAVKGTNMQIIPWDGNESSLQRGDVCTANVKSGGGHVFIWLGNGKIANGALGSREYLHIKDKSGCSYFLKSLDHYHYWYILRLQGGGTGGTNANLYPDDFYSKKPKIAEAATGESGLRGQKAGDQKNEVRTGKLGSNWADIIRPKDPAMALKIANAAKQAAKNQHIGYDKNTPDRKTAINEAKKVNYNIPAITTNCECTCGELANLAWAAAGVPEKYTPLKRTVWTGNIWDNVKDSGLFERIDFSESKVLPGDVVRRKKGDWKHTAVVISSPNRLSVSGGGLSSKFMKKDSLTILDEIKPTTGKRYSIGYPSGTSSNCAQSFAYVNGLFAVAFVRTNRPPGHIQTYDGEGHKKQVIRNDNIKHANGACSTPDGELLVAGALASGQRQQGQLFTVSTDLESKGTKSLPATASSIAYDKETEKYILSAGGTMRVYDKDLNINISSISRSMHGTYYQDIGAGCGYVFACHTKSKGHENNGENYVDIYSEDSGDYCGSYKVSYGELESCDIVNGELVLLVHILGNVNYIHYTGIEVGGDMASNQGVSILDLDIISAYNMTISNTSMYINEKRLKDLSGDNENGYLEDRAYRDVSGKKVKVYWFGKNRGMINYEKDFKSKIDKLFKGDAENENSRHFYKIVIADKAETTTTTDSNGNSKTVKYIPATLKEKEVDELMEPIFGLDPKAQYVNSKTVRQARTDAAIEAEAEKSSNKKNHDLEDMTGTDEELDNFQIATTGKKGSATHLEAACAMSDETGLLLYGEPVYIEDIGSPSEAISTGILTEPLGSFAYTWTSPFTQNRWGRPHTGVDLAAPTGTKIYAANDGTVTISGWYGNYGNCCVITNGSLATLYGHMATAPVVNKGDRVRAGELIGYVGSTGNSSGPHLHFEVLINGKPQNPVNYLGSLKVAKLQ